MIVGICGLIGAGKDTVADYLVNIHQFRRESFANSLKDAVSSVFNWDRELLEGRTKQSREWREQPDPWWTARLAQSVTPRWVLQYWGTEVCRRGFHDDIWIASLENKIRNSRDDIVISDCRFPNEIQAIKRAGGRVIRVVRGPEPAWFDTALGANAGILPDQELLRQLGVHASETAWIGTEFDAVIDNNEEGFNGLYQQVNDLLLGLQPAKVDHS